MRRSDLVSDCARCKAYCCVALSFDRSPSFAFAKQADEPCPYLTRSCRCAIHAELAPRGMGGCAAFECYGAGPRATRTGADAQTFLRLREVHEQLWYLTEARKLCATLPELDTAIAALDAAPEPVPLPKRELAALLGRVGKALRNTSRFPPPSRALRVVGDHSDEEVIPDPAPRRATGERA
jgi:hypothetical protein